MARFRTRYFLALTFSLGLYAWFGSAALADDCRRFAAARDGYLHQTAAGMSRSLEQMAQQRQVPLPVAAFYWGGALLQAEGRASMASLAQLTLATYQWSGNAGRAETNMARIADEHGSAVAALFAGLMLSDDRGARDPYRARLYLADAARGGNGDAAAFLAMYDTCTGRSLALN